MAVNKDDILWKLKDLHKQATTERSHFYVASVVEQAIVEISALRVFVTEVGAHLALAKNKKPKKRKRG